MDVKKILAGVAAVAISVSLVGCQPAKPPIDAENPEISSNQGGEYAPGITTEKTFESKFLGLKFETPDGFTLLSEEMLEQASQTAGVQGMATTEMMVMATMGMPNLIITTADNTTNATAKELIDQVKTGYEAANGTVSEVAEGLTIAGEKYESILVSVDAGGMTMKQQFGMKVIGGKAVSVVITLADGNEGDVEKILGGFSKF